MGGVTEPRAQDNNNGDFLDAFNSKKWVSQYEVDGTRWERENVVESKYKKKKSPRKPLVWRTLTLTRAARWLPVGGIELGTTAQPGFGVGGI